MTVTPIAGRTLAPHEREFVRRVLWHLRDVPKPARAEVERAIVEHLMDRPATADEDALWTEVGVPGAYARTVRDDHGLGVERTDWYARWLAIDRMRRWIASVLVIALIAAAIAGGLTVRWWLTWEANISSPAFGICSGMSARSTCPGVEAREAAGRHEAVVEYVPGGGFEVLLLPLNRSGRTVRILSVDAPTPGTSLYRLDSVAVDDATTRIQEAVPFRPYDLGPNDVGQKWIVRFRFDDCRAFGGVGGGQSFDELVVRYEALGRRRTTSLTLPSRISVLMRTACPTG